VRPYAGETVLCLLAESNLDGITLSRLLMSVYIIITLRHFKCRRLITQHKGCREDWLHGTLDHEVGTHYLRFVNERKQPWHGKKGRRAYLCANKNPTEEGLASLHTVLSRPGHCMYRSAMNYYAAWKAQSMSFCECFKDLLQITSDEEAAWDFTLRVKRGYEDTSQPGSFCKDQMYLAGALKILHSKDRIDFKSLYMGQIALEDAERLRSGGDVQAIQIPNFMKDMSDYLNRLANIMSENDIDMSMYEE